MQIGSVAAEVRAQVEAKRRWTAGSRPVSPVEGFPDRAPPRSPRGASASDSDDPGVLSQLACSLSRGDRAFHTLARRPGRVTGRTDTASGPLIVKLWNLHDPRSAVRRLARHTKGRCEWNALGHLHRAGVAVPEPLGFFPLRSAAHHEALVIEDLAPCETLHSRLHGRSKAGDTAEAARLTEQLIGLTAEMVAAGVYDNDHRLANFVVRDDGRVFRIDFENARRLPPGSRRDWALGVMLGALVSSYAWVVRFEPSLTPPFVEGLLEAVRPGERSLRHARKAAAKSLRRRHGGSKRILPADLGW